MSTDSSSFSVGCHDVGATPLSGDIDPATAGDSTNEPTSEFKRLFDESRSLPANAPGCAAEPEATPSQRGTPAPPRGTRRSQAVSQCCLLVAIRRAIDVFRRGSGDGRDVWSYTPTATDAALATVGRQEAARHRRFPTRCLEPANKMPSPSLQSLGLIRYRAELESRSTRIQPLSEHSYRVVFTASERLKEKLDRASELAGHSIAPSDVPALLGRGLDLLIEREERRRYGSPRSGPTSALPQSDAISRDFEAGHGKGTAVHGRTEQNGPFRSRYVLARVRRQV